MKIYTIITSLLLLIMTHSVSAEEPFERTTVNLKLKTEHYEFTLRDSAGLNEQHYRVRREITHTPITAEYRHVIRSSRLAENWIRLNHKQSLFENLSLRTAYEYRFRESRNDIFRFRPQFTYKLGNAFVSAEPHFQYDMETGETEYKQTQLKTGYKFKVAKNFEIKPVYNYWVKDSSKNVTFFAIDFKYSM